MKKKKKRNNPPRNKTKLSELNNRIYKNKTKLTLSVQFSTVAQLCPTLCDPVNQASLSMTNSWSPPKPMSIESLMPSSHLILCHTCPKSRASKENGFFHLFIYLVALGLSYVVRGPHCRLQALQLWCTGPRAWGLSSYKIRA